MHDDRDSLVFAAKPLLDIDAVVDAYCEADHVRQVAMRVAARVHPHASSMIPEYRNRPPDEQMRRVSRMLFEWADAREASVAAMLEE